MMDNPVGRHDAVAPGRPLTHGTNRMSFSGYPAFVVAACAELGLPETLKYDAGRQKSLTDLSNIVSQALHDGTAHPDTLRRLRELRDGLHAAAQAATYMVGLVDDEVPPAHVIRHDVLTVLHADSTGPKPRKGKP